MRTAAIVIVLLAFADTAYALPRFAARNGLRCAKCHVNPSGGGMRNRYGADVFGVDLIRGRDVEPSNWIDVAEDDEVLPFTGAITDWLSVGADLRAAYFLNSPNDGRTTSTFFLMQADLYHSATLGEHLTVLLDVGVNSGFEAWALLRPWPTFADADIAIRVGRFYPAFGLRFANHSLFTRERIGMAAAAQDTGVEIVVDSRHAAATIALTNGTLGEAFDTPADARRFDKAVLARGSVRIRPRPFAFELGSTVYFNQNVDRPNPVFQLAAATGQGGVDELRLNGFLMASVGRIAWLTDVAYVHDRFVDGSRESRRALAAYSELSMHVFNGLDTLVGMEYLDGRLDASSTDSLRYSAAVEWFVLPFTELRLMIRHAHGPGQVDGPVTDVVAFLHAFL